MRIALNIPCSEVHCGKCRFAGLVHTNYDKRSGRPQCWRPCILFQANCYSPTTEFSKRKFRRCRACFTAEDRAQGARTVWCLSDKAKKYLNEKVVEERRKMP